MIHQIDKNVRVQFRTLEIYMNQAFINPVTEEIQAVMEVKAMVFQTLWNGIVNEYSLN
jgi:hypothetical protein